MINNPYNKGFLDGLNRAYSLLDSQDDKVIIKEEIVKYTEDIAYKH